MFRSLSGNRDVKVLKYYVVNTVDSRVLLLKFLDFSLCRVCICVYNYVMLGSAVSSLKGLKYLKSCLYLA